jgi:hypothetical protein
MAFARLGPDYNDYSYRARERTFLEKADGIMNADQLKALQTPLKDQYKADPASALITLRATGTATDGIACKVQTGRALVEAGLHPATGGDGSSVCSG